MDVTLFAVVAIVVVALLLVRGPRLVRRAPRGCVRPKAGHRSIEDCWLAGERPAPPTSRWGRW